jgi:SHS2 domain-containing protein
MYPARMSEGWRTFEHTADLGLEVWADTPERLFALAAEALLAQVAECGGAGAGAPERAEAGASADIRGGDAADVFVEWLNRALLTADVEQAVWTRAVVEVLEPGHVRGTFAGPRRDRAHMTYLREIKAVSHHGLDLRLEPGRCRARMVLDL